MFLSSRESTSCCFSDVLLLTCLTLDLISHAKRITRSSTSSSAHETTFSFTRSLLEWVWSLQYSFHAHPRLFHNPDPQTWLLHIFIQRSFQRRLRGGRHKYYAGVVTFSVPRSSFFFLFFPPFILPPFFRPVNRLHTRFQQEKLPID